MTNIVELDLILRKGEIVKEEVLNEWIQLSDIANIRKFFNVDAATSFAAVQNISNTIVSLYLNNNNLNEVSLHCKTKFCILLNNFALYPPVRKAIFTSLDKLTSVFEKSIADESKMPFESELGRMSEHVLVLLMRCTDYSIKAAAVHEFAEGQTQFAIQLFLAILLKEPPYEFDLRCNCITGIYGFTYPQAFFTAGEEIKENSCAMFTEKINFILNHMLRLRATQVVSDVLKDAMLAKDTNPAVLRRGISDAMRTIMNIFKFSSEKSSEWRSHILLQTNFLQETVAMHTQFLVNALQKQLMEVSFFVSIDLMRALLLTFRFCVFATYHLGKYAAQLRKSCSFLKHIFTLPIQTQLTEARQSGIVMSLYVSVLHFMCNMDALNSGTFLEDNMPPELSSAQLARSLQSFLEGEVASCGLGITQAWQKQFLENAMEWPHETENFTYSKINAMFDELILRKQPPAVTAMATRLPVPQLPNEMASIKLKQTGEVGMTMSGLRPSKEKPQPPALAVESSFRCVLTGELMRKPVKSPYGHSFEREAILHWLDQNGSVCPITGKPLEASQLVPDSGTGAKIMQQIVTQSMAIQFTEDDLYNF